MSKSKLNWFACSLTEWYPPEVEMQSLEVQGAYWRVLKYMWQYAEDQSTIEDHPKKLAHVVGVPEDEWLRIREAMQNNGYALFEEQEDKGKAFLHCPLLAEKHKEAQDRCTKGKIAADARWGKDES